MNTTLCYSVTPHVSAGAGKRDTSKKKSIPFPVTRSHSPLLNCPRHRDHFYVNPSSLHTLVINIRAFTLCIHIHCCFQQIVLTITLIVLILFITHNLCLLCPPPEGWKEAAHGFLFNGSTKLGNTIPKPWLSSYSLLYERWPKGPLCCKRSLWLTEFKPYLGPCASSHENVHWN